MTEGKKSVSEHIESWLETSGHALELRKSLKQPWVFYPADRRKLDEDDSLNKLHTRVSELVPAALLQRAPAVTPSYLAHSAKDRRLQLVARGLPPLPLQFAAQLLVSAALLGQALGDDPPTHGCA